MDFYYHIAISREVNIAVNMWNDNLLTLIQPKSEILHILMFPSPDAVATT